MDSGNLTIKYKNQVINVGMIAIAVFVAFKLYVAQQNALQVLVQQRNIEDKKNGELSDIKRLEKRISALKKYVNQKDLSTVMDTINLIAQDSNVHIVSVRPLDEKPGPILSWYPFSYTIQAPSYHALGLFISKIEGHQYVFTVSQVEIKPMQATPDTTDSITATMEISTIMMKD